MSSWNISCRFSIDWTLFFLFCLFDFFVFNHVNPVERRPRPTRLVSSNCVCLLCSRRRHAGICREPIDRVVLLERIVAMPNRMSSEMPSTDSALLIASLMAVGNDNSDGQNRSSRISSPFPLLSLRGIPFHHLILILFRHKNRENRREGLLKHLWAQCNSFLGSHG
jgi:hypothetical protein